MGGTATVRLKVDARQSAAGWRWEGLYPADATELDAFTDLRGFDATLPGAGMLKAAGSPLPREFIRLVPRMAAKPWLHEAKGSQTQG